MKRSTFWLTAFLLLITGTTAFAQTPVVITPENASGLQELSVSGRGALMDVQLIDDGARVLALSTGGISIFDAGLTPQDFIPFETNYMGTLRSASLADGWLSHSAGQALAYLPYVTLEGDSGSTLVQIDLAARTQSLASEAPGLTSPDGRWQVITPLPHVGDLTVDVIDTTSAERTRLVEPERGRILGLGFSPDSARLILGISSADRPTRLELWDLATSTKSAEVELIDRRPRVVVTGAYVTVEQDDGFSLAFYDAQTLEERDVIDAGTPIGGGGGLVVYRLEEAEGDVFVVYDIAAGSERTRIVAPSCYPARLNAILGAEALYVYYAADSGVIRAYDLQSGALLNEVGGFGDYPTWNAAGDALYVGGGNMRPFDCAFNSAGNGAQRYDLQSMAPAGTMLSSSGPATHIALDAANDRLAAARARGIDLFRASSGERLGALELPDAPLILRGLAFSAGGAFLAADLGDRVVLWRGDALDGAPAMEIPHSGGGDPFWSRVIDFWGERLIYRSENDVRLYDPAASAEIAVLAHDHEVMALGVGGDTLAVLVAGPTLDAAPALVTYALAESGPTPLATAALDPEGFLRGLAVSPDGALVALAQPNGDIVFPGTLFYDAATGQQVGTVDALALPLAFSADGARLFGSSGTMTLAYGVP